MLLILSLSSCAPAPSEPGGKNGTDLSPTSVSLAGPPTGFDLSRSVTLDATGWPGVLDGLDFYVVDYGASVLGVDVTSGRTKFDASLTSHDGGSIDWICPVQAADDKNVYTVVSNYSDQNIPIQVELTAISKQTGEVLWRYLPETTVMPGETECGVLAAYRLVPTPAGLLFIMAQWSDYADGFDFFSMLLDSKDGETLWGAGDQVDSVPGSNFAVILPDSGVSVLDLRSMEERLVLTTPALQKNMQAFYVLVGQLGENLLVLKYDMMAAEYMDDGPLEATVSLFQISASTGELVSDKPVVMESQDLWGCKVTGGALVCTGSIDPLSAVGVSVQNGSTLWQHNFSDQDWYESIDPVLFDGYLYGLIEGSSFILDTSTGSIVSTGAWPQPVVVNEEGMIYTVVSQELGHEQLVWAPAKR